MKRRIILVIGALTTIAGSLTIEISVLLLVTPIPTSTLAESVLIGIAMSGVGLALLWFGRRM